MTRRTGKYATARYDARPPAPGCGMQQGPTLGRRLTHMPDPTPLYANDFRDATVLITGGAGFIGSNLADRLMALGANVRVIDNLSTGRRDNLPADGFEFIEASILDEDAVRTAVADCRYVFHHAAFISVPLSVERPMECYELNVMGTEIVLEACRDAGVQRLMFAASAAAYGEALELPCREDMPPDCHSPYAASKVAGESLLSAFSHGYGMSTAALRYFNVFGPRQDPMSAYAAAISAFADALIAGESPTVFGDGEQTRDWVYIDNVVHANLLAATTAHPVTGEVINVGTGDRVSLLQIIEHMCAVLEVDIEPRFGPTRAGDVRHSLADISRARELLGYEPQVGFEEGLRRTLEWMKGD